MAITDAVILSASPYRLKLRVAADGGGGSVDFSNAQLLAACPPGPLEKLMAAPYASTAALRQATIESPKLSIYVTPESVAALSIDVAGTGPSNLFTLTVGAEALASGIVEVVAHHTIDR